jgi:hypothetical protein
MAFSNDIVGWPGSIQSINDFGFPTVAVNPSTWIRRPASREVVESGTAHATRDRHHKRRAAHRHTIKLRRPASKLRFSSFAEMNIPSRDSGVVSKKIRRVLDRSFFD